MNPDDQSQKASSKSTEPPIGEREIDDKVRLFQRAYDSFPDDDSKKLLAEGSEEQITKLLEENNFTNPGDIKEARGYWHQYKNLSSENSPQISTTGPIAESGNIGAAEIGSTTIGLGTLIASPLKLLKRGTTYENLQESVSKQAVGAAKQWQRNEEKYLEEIKKNPKFERPKSHAKSRAEAAEASRKQTLDNFVRINNKKAKKWVNEHPTDARLAQSVDRIEIEKKDLTQEEFKQIRDRYSERAGRGLDKSNDVGTMTKAVERKTFAEKEINDKLVRVDEKRAKAWAIKSNDKGLLDALEKKRQADIAYARENQGRISKILKRNPEKKFTPITPNPPTPTPTQYITPRSSVAVTSSRPLPRTSPIPRSTAAINNKQSRLRRGGATASKTTKTVAKKTAKRGAAWIFSLLGATTIAIIAAVVLGILIVVSLLFAFCGDPFWGGLGRLLGTCSAPYKVDVPPNVAGVTVQKVGPSRSENGKQLSYLIRVTYNPNEATIPIEELSVFDVPLFDFSSPSSSMDFTPQKDESGNSYLVFSLADSEDCVANNFCEFDLTLTPTNEDFFAINAVYVRQDYQPVSIVFATNLDNRTIDSGDLLEGRNDAPSDRTCGGQWNVKNHPNFGDPACTYTPAKFSAYIEVVENKKRNWKFWEDISISEGSTDKIGGGINVFGSGGSGTFQMIPNSVTGNLHNHGPGNWPPPAGASNSPHGDVTWQRQIEQAVGWNDYLASTKQNFFYWGTAYCLCYFDSYRNSGNGWCDDIISDKRTRCPQECYPGGNSVGSCSVNTDRLAKQRGNSVNCRQYRCNIGITGRDANTDKPW